MKLKLVLEPTVAGLLVTLEFEVSELEQLAKNHRKKSGKVVLLFSVLGKEIAKG